MAVAGALVHPSALGAAAHGPVPLAPSDPVVDRSPGGYRPSGREVAPSCLGVAADRAVPCMASVPGLDPGGQFRSLGDAFRGPRLRVRLAVRSPDHQAHLRPIGPRWLSEAADMDWRGPSRPCHGFHYRGVVGAPYLSKCTP